MNWDIIEGNWKLYAENLRDTYHASLLHEFFVTYGVDRATQKGGVRMDERHRHNMNYAFSNSDTQSQATEAYAGIKGVELDRMRLSDLKILDYRPEFADGLNLATPTFFPNAIIIQINNSLSSRQIRPKGVDSHEIFQTLFGYEDDTEEMQRHRLISANLVGSRTGRAIRALHDGEAAAESLGVDTFRLKLKIFVWSALYASLAGSLYAHTLNFIAPSSFGFMFSIINAPTFGQIIHDLAV